MDTIKQVWVTEHDTGLIALSIESEHVKEKFRRIKVHEYELPDVPSERNPLRHVINLSLFNEEDLKKILVGICKYLKYEMEV